MSRSEKKANRLLQIEALLLAHPEGLTQAEIARKLQVNRSTIGRYIPDLEKVLPNVYIDDLDGSKWKLDRERYLVHVQFNLYEALAIHLAARLLATRMDRQNSHAAAALRKLGISLEKLAPEISAHVKQAADVMDDAARFQDPRYVQVLEKLTLAWAERRKVRVWHRYEKTDSVHEYVFAPYFIEPYAVGQTTHVIGWREPPGELRTFKIERIERIEDVKNPPEFYKIPDDFDPRQLLADAWGIWYTEEAPQEVVLRFSAQVAHRVRETLWHGSQKIETLADGRVLWRARVAEPKEMLPWLRGWGSDVEVQEPEGLREEMKIHVYKSTQMYKLMTTNTSLDSRLLRLWGKTTKNSDLFHPALYHMLDVAHVAQQLLSFRATPRWRQTLARVLNAKADGLHEWLPYLIALHDIGKLSVPFQMLNARQVERLKGEGFEFGRAEPADGRKLHHTIAGRLLMPDIMVDWPDFLRMTFQEMISGHHGIYQAETPDNEQRLAYIQEPVEWAQLREQAAQLLQSYLLRQWPEPLPEPQNISTAIVTLNGFCILCDWLGSDETYFTPRPFMPLAEYVLHSRQQAYRRVKDAGFFQTAVSHAPATFTGLFNFAPRPLQAQIDQIPAETLAGPTLTIIEAPTGEGKTEAALALARRIADLYGTDEMYIALPTTATSNAMYGRFQEHLEKRLGLPRQLVRLVHGQSFLKEDDLPVEPLTNGDGEEMPALEWFAPKKVALLAPFGVGTVDQAELAALNVRHNALRLIGLAGKVVILDEVHAYDTYMTTIIKRMLNWLAALGSSVILLSATLPTNRRQELAEAFAGKKLDNIPDLWAYPNLLTIPLGIGNPYAPADKIEVHQPNKIIHLKALHFTDEQAAEKAAWLLEKVQGGGCACWITNTVGRAQAIFEYLEATAPLDLDLTLIHGRFPLEDRQKIEVAVLNKYGKNGVRPDKGIVVGTQVLEQSLDLDFDVMVTDLAPVDLILQRAGRLHRHERNHSARHQHTEPHLFINMEMGQADKAVYKEYILQMTVLAMDGRSQFTLPEDYRPLVEIVYDPTPPGKDSPLYTPWDKLVAQMATLEDEAHLRLANEPDPDYPFYRGAKLQDFKEDENSSAWAVAQTRWGQESITLIPLMQVGEATVPILADNQGPVALNQKASRPDQLRLLQRSIRISHPALVKDLKWQNDKPKLFTESALLKHCAPLWLKPHDETHTVFINYDLTQSVYLHRVRGLVFGRYQDGQNDPADSSKNLSF